MRRIAIAAATAAAVAGPALAGEPVNLVRQSSGHTYFNRPGASIAQHDAELFSCLGGRRPSGVGGSYGPVGGIAGAIISGSIQAQIAYASAENCMVISGWRVVRVPAAEGAALEDLPRAELSKTLSEWVGASTPTGEIVRVWANDAARVSTITRAMPGMSYRVPMSVRALPEPPKPDPAGTAATPKVRPNKLLIWQESKPEALAVAPADAAVLVLTLRNSAPREWTRISLLRLGPDPATAAWTVDGKTDVWSLAIPRSQKGQPAGAPVSKTFAVVVPPGRWAISMISDLTSTCFGAPFFEAGPGEVVYAGTIDFGVDGLPIDLGLEPARARLAGYPALAARARPAAWSNGATFACGFYGYALEYPDLPFTAGYRRAGAP